MPFRIDFYKLKNWNDKYLLLDLKSTLNDEIINTFEKEKKKAVPKEFNSAFKTNIEDDKFIVRLDRDKLFENINIAINNILTDKEYVDKFEISETFKNLFKEIMSKN